MQVADNSSLEGFHSKTQFIGNGRVVSFVGINCKKIFGCHELVQSSL